MSILDRFRASPQDKFAAEVERAARRLPGVTGTRYDRDEFGVAVLRQGKDEPIWIYLHNAFGECAQASADERRDRIERLVRLATADHASGTWAQTRPRLRPVVRPVTFGQHRVVGMEPAIRRPAMPFLSEYVVVDHPESMAYVMPGQVEEWGVTPDEIFEVARANLAELAQSSLQQSWPTENAIVRMVDTGDGYFASMPLVPGWLAGVSERMGGPVIAFVPDVNTVLLTRIPPEGLGPWYELAEEDYKEAVRGVSPVGYVSDDRGRTVPYAPPAGHVDHVAARRAEVILALSEYGAQTEWLKQQYQEAGIDVFVANLLAAAKPGEAPITIATWTDGITSLLPEAQLVAFVGQAGIGPQVPWRTVVELAGLQPEPLLSPLRYRVESWPPADVMDRLRAHAVE